MNLSVIFDITSIFGTKCPMTDRYAWKGDGSICMSKSIGRCSWRHGYEKYFVNKLLDCYTNMVIGGRQ